MKITAFRCDTNEDAGAMAIYEGYLRDRADAQRREDSAERMAGNCERCQEPHAAGLTVSGGVALCDDCLEVELAMICDIEHGPTGYHCTLPPGHRGPFCYVADMFFNASTCEHRAEHVDQRTLGGCDSWCNKCGVALHWHHGHNKHYPCDGIPF